MARVHAALFCLSVISATPILHIQNEDMLRVQLVRHQNDVNDDEGASFMPNKIMMTFSLGGEDVELRLQRVRYPPVYVVDNNGITPLTNLDDSKSSVYVDPSRAGTFIVHKTEQGQFTLDGSVSHKGTALILQPELDSAQRSKRSADSGDVVHIITPVGPHVIDFDGIGPHDDEDHGNNTKGNDEAGRKRRQTAVRQHVVETAFISDFTDYSAWKAKYPTDTDLKMRNFYTYVAQSLNNIYDSVFRKDSSIAIKVAVTALYVLKTSGNTIITVPSGTLDGDTYLTALTNWLSSQSPALPQNDHYMAFTQYDVTLNGGMASGVGALAAMCKLSQQGPRSVSVVENNFGLQVPFIASHELGHTLGASHDGSSSASTCPSTQYNVMTPTLRTPTPQSVDPSNPYTFSQCSINAFKAHLTESTCTELSETSPASLALPFTSYSSLGLNSKAQQCQEVTGFTELCPMNLFGIAESSICTEGFLCRTEHTAGPSAYNCTSVIPFDGTSCGTQQICFRGACVSEASVIQAAPYFQAAPETTTPTVTTPGVTTQAVTTPAVTTQAVTTPAVTTPAATTQAVTTPAVTTPTVITQVITTPAVTTQAVTTPAVATPVVTTQAVTTPVVTTQAVTTPAVTTKDLSTDSAVAVTKTTTTPTTTTRRPPRGCYCSRYSVRLTCYRERLACYFRGQRLSRCCDYCITGQRFHGC